MSIQPTAQSDPVAYLACRKFSQLLRKCPRTGLRVSYADIGDPNGIPVLWVLPSGCSRWFAAPQDPLAHMYGLRLILVDRPGVGATPDVPLQDRITKSADLIVSVLEHLNIKPNHMIVTSAGIYYALHLLTHHASVFANALSPAPFIYMVAPWSPLLPSDHADYYPSYFTWIPSQLIATQHQTLPQINKILQTTSFVWQTGIKTFWSTYSSAREVFQVDSYAPSRTAPAVAQARDPAAQESPLPMTVDGVEYRVEPDDETSGGGGLWGRFPCCVSCTTTEYFQAENFSGVGQEHLICLNRGPRDTGHRWLERATTALADEVDPFVDIHVWWGWKDNMVPRKGQLWFNKNLQRHANRMHVTVHDVPSGDHSNLLGRADGIHEVYQMIKERR